MMRIKAWGQSFLKIILILFLIYGANKIFADIHLQEGLTYTPQLWKRTAVSLISYGGIGAILGLKHFTLEMKKKGTWKADWPKLIFIGLPSLFYSLSYVIGAYANPFLGHISYFLIKPLFIYDFWSIICLFSLILGHTIISGFYKYEESHSEQNQE